MTELHTTMTASTLSTSGKLNKDYVHLPFLLRSESGKLICATEDESSSSEDEESSSHPLSRRNSLGDIAELMEDPSGDSYSSASESQTNDVNPNAEPESSESCSSTECGSPTPIDTNIRRNSFKKDAFAHNSSLQHDCEQIWYVSSRRKKSYSDSVSSSIPLFLAAKARGELQFSSDQNLSKVGLLSSSSFSDIELVNRDKLEDEESRVNFGKIINIRVTHSPPNAPFPFSSGPSDQILGLSVKISNFPKSGEDHHLLYIGLNATSSNKTSVDYPELFARQLQKYFDKVNLHPSTVQLSDSKILQLTEELISQDCSIAKSKYGSLSQGMKKGNGKFVSSIDVEGEVFFIMDVDPKKKKENEKIVKELRKICGREMTQKHWSEIRAVGGGVLSAASRTKGGAVSPGSGGWIVPRIGIFGALRQIRSIDEVKSFAMIKVGSSSEKKKGESSFMTTSSGSTTGKVERESRLTRTKSRMLMKLPRKGSVLHPSKSKPDKKDSSCSPTCDTI